jgi:hypothetical protein
VILLSCASHAAERKAVEALKHTMKTTAEKRTAEKKHEEQNVIRLEAVLTKRKNLSDRLREAADAHQDEDERRGRARACPPTPAPCSA